MNYRCTNCGLLNLASSSACKRCRAAFDEIPSAETGQQVEQYPTGWQGGYELAAPWPQPAYQPSYFHAPVAALPARSKSNGTNVLLWVLLCGAVVIAAGIGFLWKFNKPASENYSWQEYQAPDNSFAVSMPTKPVETSQSQANPKGTIEIRMLTGNMKKDGFYGIAYTDYPGDVSKVPSSALLDASAQGAAKNSGAHLVGKKSITLDGNPGIEIDLDVPPDRVPGGGKGVCRIFWVSPRIYVVCVAGPVSSGVYASRTKYLDSFRLKK